MYKPIVETAKCGNLKSGFAFGISQFMQYLVFSGMMYIGGKIIKDSIDEATGLPTINPEDVFKALFAIMFGAFQVGQAIGFGPDVGKAE